MLESHSPLILIPLIPLAGFVINGVLGRRFGPRFVSVVGCLAPIGSFYVSYQAWKTLQAQAGAADLTYRAADWLSFGEIEAPWQFLYDELSATMCLMITGVGSLIHLYSTGYMKGDPSYHRFFAYLNLFMASMLILVLGQNLLVTFVGWEGVGLCSYLLIGFWHQVGENASAGRKAFLYNRIGDFGFLLATFLLLETLGTIDATEIVHAVESDGMGGLTVGLATAITLLLFLGATGKSAQIPLFVWLPDAMAGPTPVSALIHAATMVTSGVYVCCRLMPLFELAPTTLAVIAGIGASTALLAALIALTQNDIKKVLAYSTVSQLGYMFYAIGVGAFAAAFFHVLTHAFFKALLFLGSGSVIHAMHHEQDMRKMGGLRKQLPFTHLMFLIGTAAIAGVPVFAGFFSKDEILFSGYFHAFGSGHGSGVDSLFWVVAVVTAGLTAFYMLRLVALTFWGESRVDSHTAEHVHEPGGWMPWVLAALAVLSILGGLLSVPDLAPFNGAPFDWIAKPQLLAKYTGLYHGHYDELVQSGMTLEQAKGEIHGMEYMTMGLSIVVAFAGLGLAWFLYGPGRAALAGLAESSAGRAFVKVSSNKFYVDELYHLLVVAPFQFLSYILWIIVDRFLIDGVLVGGSALLVRSTGEFFRRMQSGFIPAYVLTFGCGALVLLFILMRLTKGAV